LDDKGNLKDLERQKLLEEIRKRAEEAELRRIEEDEKKVDLDATSSPVEKSSPPPPAPPSASRPHVSPHEEKINELREKFAIAMDRGKPDKADEVLEELSTLVQDSEEMDALRERVQRLRREQQEESRAKKRASEQRSKEDAAQARARREAQQKKIAALFEKANNYYQSEKYDQGLESLNELFDIDKDNEEARELAGSIARAKELAERVREEESRRRAEEAAIAPPPTQPVAPIQPSGDVWGSKVAEPSKDELGLPEVAEGLTEPPKPPLSERIADRVSNVRIPLKPVLVGIGVLALAASAYFIVISLKQAVFPPKYSLMVFPAMSTGGDSTAQFMASAITEDLITTVAMVHELRVVAPATSFSLNTYNGDLSQVARNLGANYFLKWNVTRNEDRVAFDVTLSDTLSQQPVWTTNLQNSARELQSTMREIARSIVQNMKIAPEPEEEEVLKKVSNTSPEAYEAYARGRWYLDQKTAASINKAITAFGVALQRDSLFVEAHLALAWAHILAVELESTGESVHIQAALEHVNAAIALGGRSSMSYRIRGLIAQYQSQHDRAIEELERGVLFAPSDAETQRRLATEYVIKGRLDDAAKAASHAVADDPRNVVSHTLLGMIHFLRGENQEAFQSFEQGLRYAVDKTKYMSEQYSDLLDYLHHPDQASLILADRAAQTQNYVDYYKLGRIYQSAGRPKQQWETALQRAKTVLEETIAANSLDAIAYSYLALVETRLGSFKNALEASTRARELAPNDPDVLYNTARMFALQTVKAQALEYLGKAVDRRFQLARILDMDFYNLRMEPEFQQIVTR
jgi:TolB-like protein/predicted Zn-dependent protease